MSAYPPAHLPPREEARRKMLAFYSRHHPEKIARIESILDQYEGSEDRVIRAMQMVYPHWNFDYTPPDLSTVNAAGQPYAPPSPPPHYGPAATATPPSVQRSPTLLPPPAPHGEAASVLPTRTELHDVVATLHDKLLSQQRSELSAIEGKVQQLVDITRHTHERHEREIEAQLAAAAAQPPPTATTPQPPPSAVEQAAAAAAAAAQSGHDAQKDLAIATLQAQVGQLTATLQQQQQLLQQGEGGQQASRRQQEEAQRAMQYQAELNRARRELDDLRMQEAARIKQEILGKSELEKIRRENELLKEDGEEGRELIMELHGVVEQLRHANSTKATEIETLLTSAQTLKSHYDASQGQLDARQRDLDKEKVKAQQALLIAAQVGSQQHQQQQYTQPYAQQYPAAYSPHYASPSPATHAAHVVPQAPTGGVVASAAPAVHYVSQPQPQPQQQLQQPLPHVSSVSVGAAAPPEPPRVGLSPPRPAMNAGNTTMGLMASLQRRAYENMMGR